MSVRDREPVRASTDRRRHPRFDVLGALWGKLELDEPAQIRDVSATGVLLDSPVPAALDSEQPLRVIVDGDPVTIDTRVRRVYVIRHGTESRYLLGLEFVSPPSSVLHSIELLSGHV